MMGEAAIAYMKDAVGKKINDPRFPLCDWYLVPAGVNVVHVPSVRRSGIVNADGEQTMTHREGENDEIVLMHRIDTTGMPYVKHVRWGYSLDAEMVVWSIE